MHITAKDVTPLWDGFLEKPGPVTRTLDNVSASIGTPFQWADGELLGEKWKPPLGGNRFYLLQLAFTLRPQGQMKVSKADFSLSLGSQGDQTALAFDAFPREQLVEAKNTLTLGIGPDFKLGTVDASLAKAESTIDFGSVVPVIRIEGLQESTLTWRYSEHAKYPLTGSRRMFVVVSLPQGMKNTLAKIVLNVTAEDRFGPLYLQPPDYDSARLRFVIGEK